ncbi:sulfite exporter TauE/SafE family protein [Aeoliella mucimassa]|uniref:Urease accessory protein UreH-like transmembrane domain-containing protein n=1 Tax=Aeoliella mucimassa TaxID=2527972 RepID=A0A518AM13_9BACT|nr:sulfite exporter TauE/SafE family protein [Aeoliella mucimassa]QDU55753.1 hypothetical protein Pan181_19480 [Aeoliella mucimassa]
MIAQVVTVFVASLLGSPHCAGMCGPFVAFAVGQSSDGTSRWHLQFAYHGGRLVTYALLGAVAGSLGALIDLTSTLAGLQPVATALAGGLMIAMGVTELLRHFGHRIGKLHPPAVLVKAVQRGQRLAMKLTPFKRALAIGLLTTLLPCGWLYMFALTAAGTGNPVAGAVVMAVFWAGTLPILVSLGAGVQAAVGILGKRLPLVCATALIAVGLMTLVGRLGLEPEALAHSVEQRQPAGQDAPDPNELPPCCRPDAKKSAP